MAKRILQVNFKPPAGFDMSSPEAQKAMEEAVKFVSSFPGLKWKIWILNEETTEQGGVYLFEDDGALKEYLNGPTIGQVKEMMQEASIKEFGIVE
ncbi:MAG: YdhR family protein, partial [Anaerolineae bacterium]